MAEREPKTVQQTPQTERPFGTVKAPRHILGTPRILIRSRKIFPPIEKEEN